jgi:hypothetical protein
LQAALQCIADAARQVECICIGARLEVPGASVAIPLCTEEKRAKAAKHWRSRKCDLAGAASLWIKSGAKALAALRHSKAMHRDVAQMHHLFCQNACCRIGVRVAARLFAFWRDLIRTHVHGIAQNKRRGR